MLPKLQINVRRFSKLLVGIVKELLKWKRSEQSRTLFLFGHDAHANFLSRLSQGTCRHVWGKILTSGVPSLNKGYWLIWPTCKVLLCVYGKRVQFHPSIHLLHRVKGGYWSLSQTLGEGRVHPGQVATSSQGGQKATNNHTDSHSDLWWEEAGLPVGNPH